MSDVFENLEAARDAMHADRNEDTVAAYKQACAAVQAVRVAERTAREAAGPPQVAEGDAAVRPGSAT